MNLCLSVNYSETQNMTNSTLSNFVQSNVKIMPNLENLPNAMLQIQNISIELHFNFTFDLKLILILN